MTLAGPQNERTPRSAKIEASTEPNPRQQPTTTVRRLNAIRPSPENELLYRPVLADDPEIVALADSIREHGLREPIVISTDGYIVSGHRRHTAARVAGLVKVPVRIEKVSRADEPDLFQRLLREFNRQRVKSLDEQLREAVIDADPEECRAELIDYRRDRAKVSLDPLPLGAYRARKKISPAKRPFQDAILSVIEGLRDFWPTSDRTIHYGLLNAPPLRHASKSASGYVNDQSSYKSLVELVTRMRLTGEVPFHCIGDETRPVTFYEGHRGAGAFVTSEIDNFLKGYYRNLLQSQPNHVELVVEKNTLSPIMKPIASEFCLPMTSGRGFCSLPPRHDMAQRFWKSGKDKLVVLFVTDFDPEGESIGETFGRSMRDDFGIAEILPHRVALTRDQIDERQLPRGARVKLGSSRAPGFIKRHGNYVWELEALAPLVLQEIVRTAVVSALDMGAFAAEQRQEAEDAAQLHVCRERVRAALASVVTSCG